jgi:hypothetical protein
LDPSPLNVLKKAGSDVFTNTSAKVPDGDAPLKTYRPTKTPGIYLRPPPPNRFLHNIFCFLSTPVCFRFKDDSVETTRFTDTRTFYANNFPKMSPLLLWFSSFLQVYLHDAGNFLAGMFQTFSRVAA